MTSQRIDAIGAAICVVFAGAFPLIVAPSGIMDDTDVLPKVLATRAVVLFLLLLWLARGAFSGTIRVRRTVLDTPVLAFVASAALSTALSTNISLSIDGAYTRYEGLITIATYALLYWVVVQFVQTRAQARWLLRAMLGGAAVECVVACAQAFFASQTGDLGIFGETATTFGGVARAIGTMANANNLAIWLAMLIPIGVYEAATAGRLWGRILAACTTLLMLVTLVVSFGRAAWLSAPCGVIVMVLLLRWRSPRRMSVAAVIGAAAGALAVVAAVGLAAYHLGVPLLRAAVIRLASLADVTGGSGGVRLHLYSDTVGMVATRPLLGFGPDTFGLVYPSHSTGDWLPGVVIDKAHSDILQVAATQGLLGVAAEIWLLVVLVRMLVLHRHQAAVAAVLGAVVAYEVAMQINFSWFPVTAPFWILIGAAVALTGSARVVEVRPTPSRAVRATLLILGAVAVSAACIAFAIRPAIANARYASALTASSRSSRRAARHCASAA